MKASHIFYPWKIEKLKKDFYRLWGVTGSRGEMLIAEIHRPHGNFYPTDDISNMILAAPDMYQELSKFCKNCHRSNRRPNCPGCKTGMALKKARGIEK